jgi:8-oxo-dGTP pyrophosphatase MutT (NUDIX family)
MNKTSREKNEQRLLGVAGVIERESRGERQVLLIKDESKIEVSAGFDRWLRVEPPAWSFPGGGRSQIETDNGSRPETKTQTLQNEFLEEFGLYIPISLLAQGETLDHPFMVGQFIEDENKTPVINQIGATAVFLHLDSLFRESITYIEQKVANLEARWVNFDQLEKLFSILTNHNGLGIIPYRPHVYTIAHLKYLERVLGQDESLIKLVNQLNIKTRQFLLSTGYPITNGAFDENGVPLPASKLNAEDKEFLYGSNSKHSEDLTKSAKINGLRNKSFQV